MNIIIYGINFSPELVGVGKFTGELAFWLAKQGHSVHVICAPPYFPQWQVNTPYSNRFSLEIYDHISVQRCPIWIPSKPTGLLRLIHLASFAFTSFIPLLSKWRWKPDIIINMAPTIFTAPASILFSKLLNRKCRTWLHIQDFELDAAFELGLLRGRWLRWLATKAERSLLRGFTTTSTISLAMLHQLHSKGLNHKQTVLFPNWVDLNLIEAIPPCDSNTNIYRKQLEIPDEAIVLMYSGSMNKKQGLELIVEAIDLLDDIPNIIWLLAGEGPTKKELLVATNHFNQVIHLPLQPHELMNEWLNAADIHLLPQRAGAADLVLPSKLLGMLASGRPIVSTSTKGSELETLTSKAGSCTTPGNAKEFAEALRQLINEPKIRMLAGKRARKLAETLYDKVRVLEEFERQLKAH